MSTIITKKTGSQTNFQGGIGDSIKQGIDYACAFSRSLDYRPDARRLVLLPKTAKKSGGIVTDLPVWGERINNDTYLYGGTGNLYKRDSNGVYSLEHTAPDSTGNGLAYFGEDKYLYYASNTTIGRWGQYGIAPQWYDDFLGSEGGAPTNTHSMKLLAASSQYATAADSASLSIAGDLTLEAYVKMTSLPTVGQRMTFLGKWDESGATRSYIMDVKGISNFFGDGADGALTISADTTEAPIDSACSGTIDTYSLTATNVNFAAGQSIMINQTQGTGAGNTQFTTIQSYTAGTITTSDKLNATYGTGAQVRVLKRYTNVTINSGKTYTAKAWNGTTGGILAFYANGTVTVTGTISATACGFRQGSSSDQNIPQAAPTIGENPSGTQPAQRTSVNGGGGAGYGVKDGPINSNQAGGGGGYGTEGTDGASGGGANGNGLGGTTYGVTDLTQIHLGTGGGGYSYRGLVPTDGSRGGGAIFIAGSTLVITGSIQSNGGNVTGNQVSGGAGSGGTILFKSDTATLGTTLVTASGGIVSGIDVPGGNGGVGRIHLDYATSYTGTTTPSIVAELDSSINTSDGHQLRLGISSDGTTEEFLTQTISGQIDTTNWARWSITWNATLGEANFYKNSVLLGTKTGTMNSIHDNTSLFSVGANKGASAYENFANAQFDDIRVYGTELSQTFLLARMDQVLTGIEAELKAYYKLDNAYTDSTSNANTLTGVNTPTFILNDVPFSGITTRQDQDQQDTKTGQAYTTPLVIDEAATAKKTFVPAKEPQKSIRIYISSIGSGDWTMTIHDALNRVVGISTYTNANLNTGFFEFAFTPWRPVIGATYHFHVTSTVADGTIRTGTTVDLQTCDYATFYQFLVEDDWHPMKQMLNFMAIGNERYLATYNGLTYNPMRLTLPAGFRIRSLAYWREYLCIGTWKGTSVTDHDEGKIFFWDGTSDTYNFFIDVPEGSVNAMMGSRGKLYIIAGYSSDLLLYSGGDSATKKKRIPKIDISKYIEVYPGAMTMWRTLIHMGVSGQSDSTEIEKGIYTWGSLNENYDDSLNYDYPLSTGTRTGTDTRIGLVMSNGRKLLIGWNVGTAYGVDEVDPTGACFNTGTYEMLITDVDKIVKTKQPLIGRVEFDPLVAGQSVSIKYKVDREDIWKTETVDTVGATFARIVMKDRAREVQIGADINTTTTSPTILGIGLEIDSLYYERNI